MTYHQNTHAHFRPLDAAVARQLVEFARHDRVGKTIEIAGRAYTLDYISRSSSAFWRSRGISIYYRSQRSVVRISDHWSATRRSPRSRKRNCGSIGSCWWTLADRAHDRFESAKFGGGRYPHTLLAGICGLTGFRKQAGVHA